MKFKILVFLSGLLYSASMETTSNLSQIKSSVTLVRGREHSFKKKHHWIFSGAVDSIDGSPLEGDLVWVKDQKKRVLGYGFYGTQSIAVRILSFDPKIQVEEKIFELLRTARKKRKKLGLLGSEITDSFRLFHSEGDCFPGLTIDKLNNILVIQIHHVGIVPFLNLIKNYLLQKFPDTISIILKNGSSKETKDNFSFLHGDAEICTIKENNVKFKVNIFEGQKTGFFLDQRTNREILASHSESKTILNLFCYTGGFSLYALKAGASHIVSVDSSAPAIKNAEENLSLNGFDNSKCEFVNTDCGDFLKSHSELYDIVVCDPPALVKSNRDLHKGLKHYQDLQKLALSKVKKGGLYFTFSCSQFVSSKDLSKVIFKAAKDLELNLEKVEDLHQAPCHPINLNHLESMYLKGFLFRIN